MARTVLAGCALITHCFLAIAGPIRGNPSVAAPPVNLAGAALAAEGNEEAEACAASDGACDGLSLRQLRGEAIAVGVRAHDQTTETVAGMAAGTAGQVGPEPAIALAAHEVAQEGVDVARVPSPGPSPPSSSGEDPSDSKQDCSVITHKCLDFMTYGTIETCQNDSDCRVLDISDYGGEKGKAWYCAMADKSCDTDINKDDFQPVDELPDNLQPESDIFPGNFSDGLQAAVSWGPTMTLYHTTSAWVAHKIVSSGFRPGRSGWCGGAIYFINHPHLPRSKYNPVTTKNGAILEAKVRMGRMAHFNRHCYGYGGKGVYAARRSGFNSLTFNPGDGAEFIIWDNRQVQSVRIFKYGS